MTLRSMAALFILLATFVLGQRASADVIRVSAGELIAAALEGAAPGSVIEVEPGTYHEALLVDTPGITLRGLVRGDQRPVLDGQGKLNDGVIASASPFSMTGFGVRHYKGNGVTTQGVDGVFLSDLIVDDAGLYGVYPVQSRNIEITHCTVTGTRDAGIYVGESNRALVAYNEVHQNVAGIEIENTNDAIVRDNLVYDNTAGILVFVLPGKVQKEGLRTRIYRNWALRNNRPNFGDPESIVGALPYGLGLMVMGADDTVFEENWIKDNVTSGISVVRLPEGDAAKDPELEPLTDRARIGLNFVSGNGLAPHPEILAAYGGGGDLMWDGTGAGNCEELPDAAIRGGARLAKCLDAEAPHAAMSADDARDAPAATREATLAALEAAGPVVRIRGMRFEPRTIEIEAGQTVTWINEDAVSHTVTSGTGTQPTSAPMASAFLFRGDTYSFKFDEAGDYEYLCLPHLDQAPMRGAHVKVRAADANGGER